MQQVTLSLLVGVAFASEAPNIRRTSGAFLQVRHGSAYAEVPVKEVPMPVVDHDKEAGEGYQKGSPLYNKQQRWLAKKKNKIKEAALKPAKPRAVEKAKSEQPDLQSDGWKSLTGQMSPWDYYSRYPRFWVTYFILYFLSVLLVGYIYHANYRYGLRHRKGSPYEGDAFTYNLFDCRGDKTDLPICCMAFCCPAIRWAATLSFDKVNLLNFWPALCICLFLTTFTHLTAGLTGLIFLCIAVHYRQRLREHFGHGHYLGSPSLVCLDCLTWGCCSCCALVQEAREVEKTQLTWAQGGPMVGAPTGQPSMPMTGNMAMPGTMQPSLRPSQH